MEITHEAYSEMIGITGQKTIADSVGIGMKLCQVCGVDPSKCVEARLIATPDRLTTIEFKMIVGWNSMDVLETAIEKYLYDGKTLQHRAAP